MLDSFLRASIEFTGVTMQTNANDICAWLRHSSTKVDRQGLLLVLLDGDDEQAPVTVQARLFGNLLVLWDCTIDEQHHESSGYCRLVVLERVSVRCDEHPTSSSSSALPFPFSIVCSQSEHLRLSAFTDVDRRDWTLRLATCSREMAQARMDELVDRYSSISTTLSTTTTSTSEHQRSLNCIFASPCKKVHHFALAALSAGAPRRRIDCEEIMLETKLTIVVPLQLLRAYRRWSVDAKQQLESTRVNNARLVELRDLHVRQLSANLELIDQSTEFLDAFVGPNYFRSSVDKFRVAFAFAPINLHVQQFRVEAPTIASVHFLTSGATSAVPLRFAHGGLQRMRCALSNLVDSRNLEHVHDGRIAARRSVLMQVKGRIGLLSVQLESDDCTACATANSALLRVLAQIKELAGIMQDAIANYPDVHAAVDELVRYAPTQPSAPVLAFNHVSDGVGATKSFIVTDALENQLDNLDAALISLTTKMAAYQTVETNTTTTTTTGGVGLSFDQWLSNARTMTNRCLDILMQLVESVLDAQLLLLIRSLPTANAINLHYQCQLRSDIVYSQAIATVCTALVANVALLPSTVTLGSWLRMPALLNICSLLSCYGDEKGMIEDMVECWHAVRDTTRFRFVRSFSSVAQTCIPTMDGNRYEMLVSIPLPDHLMQRLPTALVDDGGIFRISPIFWNIGINHEATFIHTVGDTSMERDINMTALADLRCYVDQFGEICSTNRLSIVQAMAELTQTISVNGTSKNIQIIKWSIAIARAVDGMTLICCKSGKDRSAMVVTLEEGRVLRENCGISEQQLTEMVVALRRDGVRRENCRKNVGKALYSFSPFQMHFIPKELRPPAGTYGQQVQS